MKRLQGFVLTFQRMVTCTYHLTPHSAISICGWRYQARHYCAYANGLSCLFCLRTTPFTLQIKLLHLCVNFFGNKLQERVAASSMQALTYFIYDLSSSKSFENYWIKKFVHLMKQKVLG